MTADIDLHRQIGELIAEVRQLREGMESLDRKVRALEISAAKWGGVIIAIGALATVAGWLAQAIINRVVNP